MPSCHHLLVIYHRSLQSVCDTGITPCRHSHPCRRHHCFKWCLARKTLPCSISGWCIAMRRRSQEMHVCSSAHKSCLKHWLLGLVVEDAPSGLQSGRAAGSLTLAVCTSLPRATLKSDANPDYIVSNLTKYVFPASRDLAQYPDHRSFPQGLKSMLLKKK